ncbi:oligogalacturonate-specific porin KdgM family protein [Vibrio algicola]|uniref:oligogalacturonate-specific porin KdgM family protein n=1 Tax=Vibrio algicola TaxID=2662262 RepID=UPI00389AFD2B
MLTLSLFAIAVTSTSAFAASIDFRHEYKHDTEANNNRVKISGSTGGNFYSVEMKFNGSDGYWFNNMERGDSEFEYGYKFTLNDNWAIQPSMPITMGDHKTTYKPQVRVYYNFDSGITTKLRYRYGIVDYTSDIENAGKDNYEYGQLTGNITYTWKDAWNFDFEANYYQNYDKDVLLFDNDNTNYELNLKIGYKIGETNWRPYAEFGSVAVDKYTSDRQLRSRIGVTYSF